MGKSADGSGADVQGLAHRDDSGRDRRPSGDRWRQVDCRCRKRAAMDSESVLRPGLAIVLPNLSGTDTAHGAGPAAHGSLAGVSLNVRLRAKWRGRSAEAPADSCSPIADTAVRQCSMCRTSLYGAGRAVAIRRMPQCVGSRVGERCRRMAAGAQPHRQASSSRRSRAICRIVWRATPQGSRHPSHREARRVAPP